MSANDMATELLTATRERLNLSQKDVAVAMRTAGFKWSQATVWSIETGDRPIRLNELEAFGIIYGVNVAVIFGGVERATWQDLADKIQQIREVLA